MNDLDRETYLRAKERKWAEDTRKARNNFLIFMAILTCVVLVSDARADDYTFEQVGCDNCYQLYKDTPIRWIGPVDVLLNPEGAANSRSVTKAIKWAIDYINVYVEVDMSYQGITDLEPTKSYESARRNTVLFTTENLSSRVLGRAHLLHSRGSLLQGWVSLDEEIREECIRGTVLHELLHTVFITHSDTVHSIMSATPYNTCEYNATLRLDDIIALQDLYPPRPNRQGVVTSFDDGVLCRYDPEIQDGNRSYQYESCTHGDNIQEIIRN